MGLSHQETEKHLVVLGRPDVSVFFLFGHAAATDGVSIPRVAGHKH